MYFIKFYADWCGPCKQLTEMMQGTETAYEVVSVNIDTDTEDRVKKYGIRGIPAVALIDDSGAVTETAVGLPECLKLLKSTE